MQVNVDKSVRTAASYVFKFLRNVSNSIEMNIDGSSTPVDFTYTATSTGSVLVERLMIVVVDVSMGPGEFGGGSALTNGVEVKAFDADDNELIDWTDGANIKTNEDWAILAGGDVEMPNSVGNIEFQPIRWTISKAGYPLLLRTGDYLRVRVQDNLTGLNKFRIFIQGVQL